MALDDYPTPAPCPTDEALTGQLTEIARRCYEARRLRTHHLPAAIFAEPAWDILLEAFLCEGHGHPLTVSSAGVAADVPPTTALRHLRLLEAHGLIQRHASSGDRRVVTLALSPLGRARMTSYLFSLAKRRSSRTRSIVVDADIVRPPE